MTATSIVEVDVHDEAFQRFKGLFDEYQKQLQAMPGDWGKVGAAQNTAAKQATAAYTDQAHLFASMTVALGNVSRGELEVQKHARNTGSIFRDIERTTGNILSNVAKTGFHLSKWAVFGGIAGVATGFFGAGALAESATSSRSTARALRVSTGQLQAANIVYDKYFDPEAVLGNVGDMQKDPRRNTWLQSLGISKGDIENRSPADILPQVLIGIRETLKKLGNDQITFESQRLNELIDWRSAQGLMGLPQGELEGANQRFLQKSQEMGQSDSTLLKWQGLDEVLETSKQSIKNTFIDALAPLAPNIAALSETISGVIKSFLGNKETGNWIDDFGRSIKSAADYLRSDDFRNGMRGFMNDLRELRGVIHSITHPFDTAVNTVSEGIGSAANWWESIGGDTGSFHAPAVKGDDKIGLDRHNPGNLRSWKGVPTAKGFAWFANDRQGIQAMAKQLLLYNMRDKLKTVEEIIGKYAPPSENDTKAYIANVLKRTGFVAGAEHDFQKSPAELYALMAAMTKQENYRSNYTPGSIRVMVESTPGSDFNVNASQVAH